VVLRLISYSSVVILFNSFGRLKGSLRTITEIYSYVSETSLYVEKIRTFLNYQPKIVSKKALDVPIEPRTIELKDISFADSEEESVINNVNMTIKPYEKIALVGYNGAGQYLNEAL
jgi:ATP-binding cassette, subfamily B, bacterial